MKNFDGDSRASPHCSYLLNQGVLSAVVLSLIPMIRPYEWQSLLLPVRKVFDMNLFCQGSFYRTGRMSCAYNVPLFRADYRSCQGECWTSLMLLSLLWYDSYVLRNADHVPLFLVVL